MLLLRKILNGVTYKKKTNKNYYLHDLTPILKIRAAVLLLFLFLFSTIFAVSKEKFAAGKLLKIKENGK